MRDLLVFAPRVEVVRMQKNDAMTEGESYRREFAFMSDGTVYTRISNPAGEGRGWSLIPQTWKNPQELERLAKVQKNKGWTAIWHPAYDPALKEYVRFVASEGLVVEEVAF